MVWLGVRTVSAGVAWLGAMSGKTLSLPPEQERSAGLQVGSASRARAVIAARGTAFRNRTDQGGSKPVVEATCSRQIGPLVLMKALPFQGI